MAETGYARPYDCPGSDKTPELHAIPDLRASKRAERAQDEHQRDHESDDQDDRDGERGRGDDVAGTRAADSEN